MLLRNNSVAEEGGVKDGSLKDLGEVRPGIPDAISEPSIIYRTRVYFSFYSFRRKAFSAGE